MSVVAEYNLGSPLAAATQVHRAHGRGGAFSRLSHVREQPFRCEGCQAFAKFITGGFQVLKYVASPTAGTCFQTAMRAFGGPESMWSELWASRTQGAFGMSALPIHSGFLSLSFPLSPSLP